MHLSLIISHPETKVHRLQHLMHQVLKLLGVHVHYLVSAYYLYRRHQVSRLMLSIGHTLLHPIRRETYFIEILDVPNFRILRFRTKHVDIPRHLVFLLHILWIEEMAIRLLMSFGDGITTCHHILAKRLEIDIRLRTIFIDTTSSRIQSPTCTYCLLAHFLQINHLTIYYIEMSFLHISRLRDSLQLSLPGLQILMHLFEERLKPCKILTQFSLRYMVGRILLLSHHAFHVSRHIEEFCLLIGNIHQRVVEYIF